jgi:hypothetical protein
MQRGMLKKHCDRNIGPLYNAFTQDEAHNSTTDIVGGGV